MSSVTLFIPGDPKAQPRARHATVKLANGKRFSTTYNPGSAEGWKGLIATFAADLAAELHGQALGKAVRIDCLFLFRRPGGHCNSKGEAKPSAPVYHTAKPDRDNLDKALLDTLTQVGVLDDDAHVVGGLVWKDWCGAGEIPGCLLIFTVLGAWHRPSPFNGTELL